MKHNNILIWFALATMLFAACGGGDYTPKPQAYLRIDMPEHSYWLVDTLCHAGDTVINSDTMVWISDKDKTFPFIFEANTCVELAEKGAPKGEIWLDIKYPQWDGVVFLTYKHLNGPADLRSQTDESARLLEKHYSLSSGIEEQGYDDAANRVFGTVYYLKGSKVASTCQFWVTDSVHHYLRGALFLNRSPNNDSLAPVLNYIQEDIEHLVETLRWRN